MIMIIITIFIINVTSWFIIMFVVFIMTKMRLPYYHN